METVKLSVTVNRRLRRKYSATALNTINAAIKKWIAADASRGIRTVHVALDDAKSMKLLGVSAISGTGTAGKIKKTIDKLWARLNPDYLVLFGGNDIIPMFVVANPSYDPGGDDDAKVPTDSPYASSSPFRASNLKSYLIPDRVVGRIPDMMSDGDPAWLVDYLTTAASWALQPASVYADTYDICCDEWKGAGAACTQYIGAPASSLLISPPTTDQSANAQGQLSARLHMIKCHGAQLDPKFYGQKESNYPEALRSVTLKPRLKPNTLAAAMCCYGAQVYSPDDPAATDPGEWPLASTYLRNGGLGFAGSTMIAWVGVSQMMCADWIVAGYLKGVLGGASLGRAFLESKQDYIRWINQQGYAPDIADEKTMIEFVLLGDPSIHPVGKTPAAPAGGATITLAKQPLGPASQERRQRRVVRAQMAVQIRGMLPTRAPAKRAALARTKKVFAAAKAMMDKNFVKAFKEFGISPAKARVEELSTILRTPTAAAGAKFPRGRALARQTRQSFAYYWSGRRVRDTHKQIRLVKVETDPKGNVLRTAVIHSS
jgi:hypothetical protein